MKRIGIIFNASMAAARELARALKERLDAIGYDCWLGPADYEAEASELASGSDLLITVGGDGTILRTARLCVPFNIPILGVNMGRVGFMTEVNGDQALEQVPEYLSAHGWTEQRTVLDVEVVRKSAAGLPGQHSWALNEVVVGRGALARLVNIEARIDDARLTTYSADGVIVATATGSTGYALAAGGPILHPESQELLLLPVSPHLCLADPIVVGKDAVVELTIGANHGAMASLDGHFDYPLQPGDVVRARRSRRVARFLRAGSPAYFYTTLTKRLNIRANSRGVGREPTGSPADQGARLA